MKKCLLILTMIFLCFQAESSIIPSATYHSTTLTTPDPVHPTVNIATARARDIEKLLGRKLKLKEKIALKVFQWKLKKGINITKQETPSKKGNTAMVLGIVAIASLFLPYVSIAAIPCAILAIIFGNQAKKLDPKDGRAKAGVILGWVTLGLIILALILVIAILAGGGFWF